MRLLLPLVFLALVALTASAVSAQGIFIKLSTAGYTETQGLKHFIFGLDVVNAQKENQVVSPADFLARDVFGNTYQISGDELQLSPRGSGSLSLYAQGKITPRVLVYEPDEISLDLLGRL
jgi:hypothetical protein